MSYVGPFDLGVSVLGLEADPHRQHLWTTQRSLLDDATGRGSRDDSGSFGRVTWAFFFFN